MKDTAGIISWTLSAATSTSEWKRTCLWGRSGVVEGVGQGRQELLQGALRGLRIAGWRLIVVVGTEVLRSAFWVHVPLTE